VKKARQNRLVLEKLEARRLLSGIWHGVDVDGDEVTVKLSGHGALQVTSTPDGIGDWIDTIALFDTTRSSSLTIKSKPHNGGDGYVDIGWIDATGESLKSITVDGYLYGLTSGSLKKLSVDGTAPSDENDEKVLSWWTIDGNLGELRIQNHLQDAEVKVSLDVNKIVIKGDLARASLLVDGQLKNMQVNGDAVDSLISVLGQINSVNIYGNMDAVTIETAYSLNNLDVGGDILNSDIYADSWINQIVTDGSIENTNIETPGWINVIDAWDWIIDTDIIAGPEGVGAIYAWDLSNVNIDTPGPVDGVYLDAYGRHDYWDDLVIVTNEGWFWPIHDEQYIDYVYEHGDKYFYYTPDYWDVYYDNTWYETYYWDTYGDVYYYDYYDYGVVYYS
jgi:hypothetical protein